MYKDNSKSIHNFILIVLDFISLAISYFLATYLWLSVIRKNSEIIKSSRTCFLFLSGCYFYF